MPGFCPTDAARCITPTLDTNLLIIGYGNPLRGDDGFGWHAALRLREIIHDDGIEILPVHQLTP